MIMNCSGISCVGLGRKGDTCLKGHLLSDCIKPVGFMGISGSLGTSNSIMDGQGVCYCRQSTATLALPQR